MYVAARNCKIFNDYKKPASKAGFGGKDASEYLDDLDPTLFGGIIRRRLRLLGRTRGLGGRRVRPILVAATLLFLAATAILLDDLGRDILDPIRDVDLFGHISLPLWPGLAAEIMRQTLNDL